MILQSLTDFIVVHQFVHVLRHFEWIFSNLSRKFDDFSIANKIFFLSCDFVCRTYVPERKMLFTQLNATLPFLRRQIPFDFSKFCEGMYGN